jgi:nucleotide-binding universal stress UspA family protein
MKIDKILIVADDSGSSINAIKYGFDLAKELGAKVALLSVVELAATEGNVDAGIFPDDAEKESENKIIDFLNRVKKEHGKNTDTEFITKTGDIKSIVAITAKEWKAKLIITGTHKRTGISKLFNGSVSESIIENSPVPVCIVPMG